MKKFSLKSFIVGVLIMTVLIVSVLSGAIADRLFYIKPLDFFVKDTPSFRTESQNTVLHEESIVIDVAQKVSPSVVTVGIEKTTSTPGRIQFNPFDPLNPLRQIPGEQETIEQDIGTGFIISEDGLIVTNKHVVDDTDAIYKVITADDQEYEVIQIDKDPNNDLAIIRIQANGLTPVTLGDSDNLRVGQFVIAIGTSLGEFRHTVTTGVISGLSRDIVAGTSFYGSTEELEGIIQTDAAINFGNSGGPLLNSSGQVIGVNVARAQADNIGFALPINIIKKSLDSFEKNGGFPAKPFLGVNYQMISQRTAILNEVPQGAYVIEVTPNSAADSAGIRADDIIIEFGGEQLSDSQDGLAEQISKYNPGDNVEVKIWRQREEQTLAVTLGEFGE